MSFYESGGEFIQITREMGLDFKARRYASGLSQRLMAEACNLSTNTYTKIENSKDKNPYVTHRLQIEKINEVLSEFD